MSRIYKSGEEIPEIEGHIKNGITIIVDNIFELFSLYDMCIMSVEPPGNTLQGIYQAIANSKDDLIEWTSFRQLKEPYFEPSDYLQSLPIPKTQDKITDFTALLLALIIAEQTFRKKSETKIQLALTIADPTTKAEETIIINSGIPALVFHKGSLKTSLIRGASSALYKSLRTTGWTIALFSQRGVSSSRRARKLMEDFRKRQLSVADPKKRTTLTKLSELQPAQLEGKTCLIVFIHGFFSTDLGVFDFYINQLEEATALTEDRYWKENVEYCGYPHNTLTAIDINASDLQQQLNRLPKTVQKILFICHSRGGLVARSAVVKLYTQDKEWGKRLVGCITAGTPHNGIGITEDEDIEQFLAPYLAYQTFKNTENIFALGDILWYIEHNPRLEGVADLRPKEGGGTFIKALEDCEQKQVPMGTNRLLSIYAVGGRNPNSNFKSWIVNELMGTTEHDLVVETESSLPDYLPEEHKFSIDCDHFDYFGLFKINDAGRAYPHVTFPYIMEAFDVPDKIKAKVTQQGKSVV